VEVVNDLTPVKKGYPGEEWATFDGKDMVLVVTLVDSSRLQRFFSGEGVYRIDREMGTWVSLPVDWSSRKAAFEGLDSVAAHMRLIQMYGLDPTCDYDIMVSFYADPAYMFRPTPDPDITTTTATVDFPAHVDENFKIGETNFLKSIALGTGFGLRYDLKFLVLRLDLGIGIHAPYDTGKRGYYNIPKFKDGIGIHFAVGYPF
jgi:hypothetical protein